MRRWLPWAAMALVVAVALAVGASDGGARTDDERSRSIAASVRCPTCRGQSVRDSDAPAAAAIRTAITERVEAGQSDDEIRSYLVAKFDDSILLTPPSSGLASVVWVLPVVVLVAASAGLVVVFRRWRAADETSVSTADRALVAVAQGRRRREAAPR